MGMELDTRRAFCYDNHMKMQDTLKQAITDSGLSHLRLSILADVNRISVMRFMRGDTSLSLEQAERLADFFGLELQPKTTPKKTRKG